MVQKDFLIRCWLLAAAFASIVFSAFPGIDVAVSQLFWNGTRFPIASDPQMQDLREGVWLLSLTVALAALLGAVLSGLTGGRVARISGRCWTFVFGVFLIGPGLVTNLVLKSYWGRARPDQVEAFGGGKVFTPALWPADQCSSNCSFVSGEAAATAALAIAIVVLFQQLRPQASARAFWAVVVLGASLALMGGGLRIAFGRHFLSDVVFAWVIVAGVALVLHRALYRRPNPVDSPAEGLAADTGS
jgi:lipid A 4'-phosphatase